MKHCVIFFVFMVGCLYSSAQDLECGIEYSEEEVQGLMTERMNILKSNSNNVAYFPIQHHIVRRADGTGGISESSIVQVEKALNEKFIDANIQFYSCNEIEYIYSDIYYDLIKNLEDESLRLAHNCPTAINIYYFGSVRKENGNSLAGYSCLAPASSNFIAIAMNYATNGTTIPHEMGHYFGLLHTHETSYGREFVNGSNCLISGDFFCDTPADPQLSDLVVNNSCVYTGNAVDENGDYYFPDVFNIMSYSRKSCRTRFSLEQLNEMNYWAMRYKLRFEHLQEISNTIITGNEYFQEDNIVVDNVSISNNSSVIFDACNQVIILKDFCIDLGSTLEIR